MVSPTSTAVGREGAPVESELTPYELDATLQPGMRVPARVFADSVLWQQISTDRSLEQLCNVATLPGAHRFVCGMPDIHEGYGFPVGGVAALRVSDGVISPGGVGYDINCGVRLLRSSLDHRDVRLQLEALVHELSRSVPAGTGRGTHNALAADELDAVLGGGVSYLAGRGVVEPSDLERIEANGCLEAADPASVSDRAKHRGRDQLGTLGAGNHFLEVQVVSEILDPVAAAGLGLTAGQVTVLIHTGSRGLGHQVCTDFVRQMDGVMARYRIVVPDRQLACAPFGSPEGQEYFRAMCAAANFAWSNRQMITHRVRGVFRSFFGDAGRLHLVYDVAHNIAKLERYDGVELCVHRKGATRAFGPRHPETPAPYREIGQPVFIPGSMGSASFVLVGTDQALARSFGSACHGAGRAMSRTAARRLAPGAEARRELNARGIVVRCPSNRGLAEEAPIAYKDVDRVVDVVHRAGLARKVARLLPLGVVKG
jgi:tRNA-splicing ligase RtcB